MRLDSQIQIEVFLNWKRNAPFCSVLIIFNLFTL
jgi:hypothetical protein